MTKTEELLDAAPEAYQRKLVRELCLSMASFIAEIDANSIDVASYLEQRLSPILMKPAVRALLDVVGKDARQLLGWKRPAEPARKAPPGFAPHGRDPLTGGVVRDATGEPVRKAECGTCGGRGEIDARSMQDPLGSAPCPDCAPIRAMVEDQ